MLQQLLSKKKTFLILSDVFSKDTQSTSQAKILFNPVFEFKNILPISNTFDQSLYPGFLKARLKVTRSVNLKSPSGIVNLMIFMLCHMNLRNMSFYCLNEV